MPNMVASKENSEIGEIPVANENGSVGNFKLTGSKEYDNNN